MATTIDSVAVVAGNRLHHSALKLADQAVRDALAAAAIKPADVDLLVKRRHLPRPDIAEPALAALIQEDAGVNPEDPHGEGHGTFSFDVANGSAGVLSALQIAAGFLRAGTIRRAVIVAGDADPGHGMAPDFPYDPVGAALVCGWDPGGGGLAGFRWMTVADAPARRRAVVQLQHGRNRLLVREDDAFAAAAAACAGTVAAELLDEHGLRRDERRRRRGGTVRRGVPRRAGATHRGRARPFRPPATHTAISHGGSDRGDGRRDLPRACPRS